MRVNDRDCWSMNQVHMSNGEHLCGNGHKEESFPASCEVTIGYDAEDRYVPPVGSSSAGVLSSMVVILSFALLS